MTTDELQSILEAHKKYLAGEKGGAKANLHWADLHGANLSGANLSGADLDFSSLPLRCGGLHWKIDQRIAAQLAYHFCSMECNDAEFLRLRNSMLDFANQFHRVEECGKLLPIGREDGVGGEA